MGLHLDDYGSDSDSEAQVEQPEQSTAGSTLSSVDIGTQPRSQAPEPSTAFSHAGRKIPIKIGMHHPILGKADVYTGSGGEATDETPFTKKRASISRPSPTQKSGLLDILPPPKKRARINAASQYQGGMFATRTSPVHSQTSSKMISDEALHLAPSGATGQLSSVNITTNPAKAEFTDAGMDLFGTAPTSSFSNPSETHPDGDRSTLLVSSAPETFEAVPLGSDQRLGLAIDDNHNDKSNLIAAGAVGHAWKDVQSHELSGLANWDVQEGLADARKIDEEKARLTAAPTFNDANTFKAVGRTTGLAGKRHQLSALLHDAQANRRALEDRIAENKRSKRHAGTKYGF